MQSDRVVRRTEAYEVNLRMAQKAASSTLRLEVTDTEAYVYSRLPSGADATPWTVDYDGGRWNRYQVWATAGAYVDIGYLTHFKCQCPGSVNNAGVWRTWGITPCKHTALLAARLAEEGLLSVCDDGRYITPNNRTSNIISKISTRERERRYVRQDT